MKLFTTLAFVFVSMSPHLLVMSMSTPSFTRVAPEEGTLQAEAAGTSQHPQQETAASEDNKGFMEDIGFSHFFTDIGLQSSASNLGLGGHQAQQGFSLPQEFSSGLGSAHLSSGTHLAGGHLGISPGLGFSASTQQEQSADSKVDPAVQGFIPSDPLSFGGYTPASSSFVPSQTTAFVAPHPSKNIRPVYNPPTHSGYANSRQPQASSYDQRVKDDQSYQQNPSEHRVPTSSSNSHFSHSSKKPQGTYEGPEYEGSRQSSNYKKQEPSYNEKGVEDGEQKDDNSYERRNSYQDGRPSRDHQDDFNTYLNDDEYRYAPTHQETRPSPLYQDDHSGYHGARPRYPNDRPRYHGDDSKYHHDHQKYHNDQPSYQDNGPPQYTNQPHYQNDNSNDGRHRSESRPQGQYEQQETGNNGKEPCKIEEKDGMTCKICKDNDGGYSEHCAHSSRRGKDSVYANSRRGGHNNKGPDVGKYNDRSHSRPSVAYEPRPRYNGNQGEHTYQQNSYQPHQDNDHFGEYSTHTSRSTPFAQERVDAGYAGDLNLKDYGTESSYDPFPEGSSYDPYVAEATYDGSDEEVIDFGHSEHGHDLAAFGHQGNDDDEFGHSHRTTVTPSSGAEHEPNEASSSMKKEKHSGAIPSHFTPLSHEDNYTELSKMVAQFQKKDRTSCKEVKKNGMSCYVCENPYGKADEECMYSNTEPHGHNIRYSEETSY